MPEGPQWIAYDSIRNEWVCLDHYRHFDWSLYPIPPCVCDGCCSREDFPGRNRSKTEARRKAIQLDLLASQDLPLGDLL